jgi:hypothetical protein
MKARTNGNTQKKKEMRMIKKEERERERGSPYITLNWPCLC